MSIWSYPQSLNHVLQTLRTGHVVALPTETVYGLAANATRGVAVAEIYALKKRPIFNPLISHFFDAEHAFSYVIDNPWARLLAQRFWPGPLTMILPKKGRTQGLADLTTAGLDTAAVRVPAHPIMRAVLEALEFPLAAPSANPSGRLSPTSALMVEEGFQGIDVPILDGGPCTIGIESTIIDLSGEVPVLLRPGSITAEELEKVLSMPLSHGCNTTIKAPGQLQSHYAPHLPVQLHQNHALKDWAFLTFGPGPWENETLNLSAQGDFKEAAARLFQALRDLDQPHRFKGIAVSPIPASGIGLAIMDRLERAAAPREAS